MRTQNVKPFDAPVNFMVVVVLASSQTGTPLPPVIFMGPYGSQFKGGIPRLYKAPSSVCLQTALQVLVFSEVHPVVVDRTVVQAARRSKSHTHCMMFRGMARPDLEGEGADADVGVVFNTANGVCYGDEDETELDQLRSEDEGFVVDSASESRSSESDESFSFSSGSSRDGVASDSGSGSGSDSDSGSGSNSESREDRVGGSGSKARETSGGDSDAQDAPQSKKGCQAPSTTSAAQALHVFTGKKRVGMECIVGKSSMKTAILALKWFTKTTKGTVQRAKPQKEGPPKAKAKVKAKAKARERAVPEEDAVPTPSASHSPSPAAKSPTPERPPEPAKDPKEEAKVRRAPPSSAVALGSSSDSDSSSSVSTSSTDPTSGSSDSDSDSTAGRGAVPPPKVGSKRPRA